MNGGTIAMFMVLIKLVPFSVAVAMLSTLIYMTFNPVYYLSAKFPASAFEQKVSQSELPPYKEDNLFAPRIATLKKHQVTRLISMVDAEFPTDNKDNTQLQASLNDLLNMRFEYSQLNDEIQFNLHVKKSPSWVNEFRAFLKSGLEFTKGYDNKRIQEHIVWVTNYLETLVVFLIAFFAAGALAFGLSYLKGKEEQSQ